MAKFEELNAEIVYTTVDSRSDAVQLKDRATKEVENGKAVVIFFENRYHLQLAPGQNPYQVRSEIDEWIKLQEKKSSTSSQKNSKTSSKSKSASKIKVESI